MTRIYQNPPPKLPPGMLLGLGIGLAVVAIFSTVQYFFDQSFYNRAMQSYKNADCNNAIEQFDRIINSPRLLKVSNYIPRAQQKQAECRYFQKGVAQQKAGKWESALMLL